MLEKEGSTKKQCLYKWNETQMKRRNIRAYDISKFTMLERVSNIKSCHQTFI